MAESSKRALSLRELDSPEKLTSYLKTLRTARHDLEADWRLNMAFYRGEQWTWYNRDAGQIQSLPTEDGEKPRNRVRLTSNLILPNVNAYVAQLTKTKPVISATPNSGSERHISSAQVAQDIYEHSWRNLHLKDHLYEALLWATVANNGWWKITWDPHAGKSMRVLQGPPGPDGQPMYLLPGTDIADLFVQQLLQMGIQPLEQIVRMGEIKVETLSPLQVYVDPVAKVLSDARFAFCIHPMDPDLIQETYGVRLEPDHVNVDLDIMRPWRRNYGKPETATTKNVNLGYFLPSPVLPEGRYVAWADGHNDFLYDSAWNYPVEELPLVQFPGIRVPGTIEGESLTTHARPIQKEINKTSSQVVVHHALTMAPQWVAPAGMFERTRMTTEPGKVNIFNPVGTYEPKPVEYPTIQPTVFTHLADMVARLDRLYNLQAISRGDVPPNVEAGVAIDLLQEAAVDQVAPQVQMIEESLVRAGRLISALAHEYYIEPRLLKITGEGGATRVREFLKDEFELDGFSYHAEVGSGLPRTRAGRVARIEQLMAMGVIHPAQAWKHLDIADLKGIGAVFAADEEQALREHEKLLAGQPLNDVAYGLALSIIEQGVNPMTGQPLTNPAEAEQILMDAALTPLPHENKAAHREVHATKMKSPEYDQYPVELKLRFQRHFELTQQQLMAEQPKDPRSAPRTSLQLRGTLGPTIAAKILNENNVPARPEEFLEMPLETMVIDSVDKADVEAAGNDPLDQYEREQAIRHAETEHYLKSARMAHEMELARKRAAEAGPQPKPLTVHPDVLKEAKEVQGIRQSEQQHRQKMRQAEEVHQERVKQQRSRPRAKAK